MNYIIALILLCLPLNVWAFGFNYSFNFGGSSQGYYGAFIQSLVSSIPAGGLSGTVLLRLIQGASPYTATFTSTTDVSGGSFTTALSFTASSSNFISCLLDGTNTYCSGP